MPALFLSLLLLAAPFWDAKAPADWTDIEVSQMLADSPWAQAAVGPSPNLPVLPIYLATAKPVQLAEAERERRATAKLKGKAPDFDPFADEYATWLAQNSKDQIILAIRVGNSRRYSEAKELDLLEKDSVLRVGKKKIQMTGYFPPSSHDPYLRIAFPRPQLQPGDKTIRFELYLPGVPGPARTVEFKLDTLMFAGRREL